MSEPDGNGERYDALKLGSQLCFPLYAAARETVKKYTPYLSELGLTYTQYIVMMVLWEEKSVSAKRLGERLLLDSGTLTPLLKTLERRGLLSRSRDGEDERYLRLDITDAGSALRERAVRIPEKIAGCMPLEPAEAAELYRLLYKILNGGGSGERAELPAE